MNNDLRDKSKKPTFCSNNVNAVYVSRVRNNTSRSTDKMYVINRKWCNRYKLNFEELFRAGFIAIVVHKNQNIL